MPNRRKVARAARVTLYLDAELLGKLEELAGQAGVTLSELIRETLRLAVGQGLAHQAAGAVRALREAPRRSMVEELAARQLARRVAGVEELLRALAPQALRLAGEAPRLDERNLRALLAVAELLRRGGAGSVEYEVALPSGEVLRYRGRLEAVPPAHRERILEEAGRLDLFFTRYKAVRSDFFRRVYYRITELLGKHRSSLPPDLAERLNRLAEEAVGIVERVFDRLDPLLEVYESAALDAAQAARQAGRGAARARGQAARG